MTRKKQKAALKKLLRKQRKLYFGSIYQGPASTLTEILIEFVQQLQELANERSNDEQARETKV